GDGPRNEIVVETPDFHVLGMQTARALVRGLTLRTKGASKGNQRFTVDIPQGQLVLEECDLTSDTLPCIGVHGAGADPIIRRCRIHDAASSGIAVWDSGRGTVEDCEIVGNAVAGVLIRDGGEPMVRRCRISDGKMFGVMCDEQSRGTVEDCDL